MTSPSKTIGKIEISTDKNLAKDILSRIEKAVSNLRKSNIEIVLQESNLRDDLKVLIKIRDIGDISDKQIREAFKIMFPDVKGDRNFAKLIDREKEFRLPDDLDECLDWFIIEK